MKKKSTFLRSSVPQSEESISRGTLVSVSGLNMFGSSGFFSEGVNVEITSDGSLRTASVFDECDFNVDGTPLGALAADEYLYVVVNVSGNNVDLIRIDADGNKNTVNLSNTSALSDMRRSLALYNRWTGGSDIVSGEYEDVLLIYPDKVFISAKGAWKQAADISRYNIIRTVTEKTLITEKSYANSWSQNTDGTYNLPTEADGISRDIDTKETIDFYCSQSVDTCPDTINRSPEISIVYTKQDVYNAEGLKTGETLFVTETEKTVTETFHAEAVEEAIPDAEHITIYNTRLFGINETKIFASGAGDYADYELDTATDIDETNAWYSATSGERFTFITTYDGRVTAFKPQGLYQVYNTQNPFRVKEISKEGTIYPNTVAETESTLFFTNETGVYSYSGSYPKNISREYIEQTKIVGDTACAGAFDGHYYVRCETAFDEAFDEAGTKPLLCFDSHMGAWRVLNFSDEEIVLFASSPKALYALGEDGTVWKRKTDNRSGVHWYAVLPVDCGNTATPKKLIRLQGVFRFQGSGKVTLSYSLDNDDWIVGGTMKHTDGTHPIYCPILSGDHVVRSIRLEGQGDVELVALEQFFKEGGVRYGT